MGVEYSSCLGSDRNGSRRYAGGGCLYTDSMYGRMMDSFYHKSLEDKVLMTPEEAYMVKK